MEKNLQFSIVIPVYNRPDEIVELLESLNNQTNKNFEVVIVEDGSAVKCEEEIKLYANTLTINYFFKPNSGPGLSRNYGFERATGNYIIFLDSDCILPPHYMQCVTDFLQNNYADAYGGPDKAHESFSTIQKAINYSMTSFFTTGGIRGGGEKMEKFHPRSFNMGCSRKVLETTKGFSKMRFGEDIDLSIRIVSNGFKAVLIKEAYAFHKRRSTFRQFFKQVFNSGIARINLHKRHKGSLKLVHAIPSIFVIGLVGLIVFAILFCPLFLIPIALHIVLLFVDSLVKNKSVAIALLSVVSSYIQLIGYGTGFIKGVWKRIILGRDEFHAFNKNFYK